MSPTNVCTQEDLVHEKRVAVNRAKCVELKLVEELKYLVDL